jgi:hypothetical protein
MRPTIFFLAVALLACAAPPAPGQNPILASEPGDSALAARCHSAAVEAVADTAARIAAGRYVLTLVAADGSARPARAHGPLWLHATSDADRSPRTGRGPAPVPGVQEYLYGAVSLDFRRIGAPVQREAGDTITPVPTSTDPIRPGVLVSRSNRGTVVLISTLGNMRDSRHWLDGAGIGLHVRQVSRDQVSGIWSGWGIVPSRQGFFCAARTSG